MCFIATKIILVAAPANDRDQASHSRKLQTARSHSHNVHWWLSHQRPVMDGRASLSSNVRPPSLKAVQPQPPSWQWMMEAIIHALCWIDSRGDSPTTPCPPLDWLERWQSDHTMPSAGLTREVTVRPHHALRWIDSRGDSQTTPCPPLDWLERWQSDHTMPSAGLTREVTVRPHHALRWIDSRGDSQTTPCPPLDWLERWQSDHTMPSAGLTREVTVRPHHALRWIDSRGDRPHHALRWIDSRGDNQTTRCPPLGWLKRWQSDHICHQPHRLSELATKSGIEGRDWNVSVVDIHLQKLLWLYHRGHAGLRGNDRADRLAGKISPHKWLASWKLWSVEELETLSASTKPMTPHHRSSGGERHGKRKRSTIFLEKTRKGHRQWDKHWNCYKGNVGGTAERRGEAHMGFLERIDTILNWNEQVKAIKRK